MRTFYGFCRALVLPVATLFAMATLVPSMAAAGMVPTDAVIEIGAADGDRAEVQAFLDREDVRAELEALGVDPDTAKARVAALSDAEIAQLAAQLPDEPAGEGHVVGSLVGAAVVIFIVLVITDILGATNVFPFVNPL